MEPGFTVMCVAPLIERITVMAQHFYRETSNVSTKSFRDSNIHQFNLMIGGGQL